MTSSASSARMLTKPNVVRRLALARSPRVKRSSMTLSPKRSVRNARTAHRAAAVVARLVDVSASIRGSARSIPTIRGLVHVARHVLDFLAKRLVAQPDDVAVALFTDESGRPVIEMIVGKQRNGDVVGLRHETF